MENVSLSNSVTKGFNLGGNSRSNYHIHVSHSVIQMEELVTSFKEILSATRDSAYFKRAKSKGTESAIDLSNLNKVQPFVLLPEGC